MSQNNHSSLFASPSGKNFPLLGVVMEIAQFINESKDDRYRLVIGTDSQIKHSNGKSEIDYVTAIVIHRVGRGARYFCKREKLFRAPALREKIYSETTRSLTTAQELVPVLREWITSSNYDLEIHVDVGPVGPTREMIKEVIGMVSGSGFIARTKPDSWAASSVADKHT